MNFSHEHEPHQIQNMDFIDMFHVLQRGLWGPANMETLSRNPAVTQHGVLLKQRPGLPSCCYFPQCVLWGVSPHLVGRVQGFRNARLAISVLLSTAESVHLCQLMCPNFTVTCEPSHAKRSNRLLLHIPIQKTYSLPRDHDFKRKMRCGHLIIRVSFLKCKLDNCSPMAVSCSAITMGRKDQALLQITRQRREIQWAEPSTELHKPLSVALLPELKTREKHSQDLQSHPASPSPDWCISSPVSWDPQPEPANSPPSCRLIVKKTKLLSEPDKLGAPLPTGQPLWGKAAATSNSSRDDSEQKHPEGLLYHTHFATCKKSLEKQRFLCSYLDCTFLRAEHFFKFQWFISYFSKVKLVKLKPLQYPP